MMKPHLIVIIIIILIFAVVLYSIFTGHVTLNEDSTSGHQLVDDNPGPDNVVWSRDSRSLFYKNGNIYRFDIKSGKKRQYRLPINIAHDDGTYYDISPDETAIIYNNDGKKLEILDITTGRIRLIYSSPNSNIFGCWWLSNRRVLFSLITNERKYDGDAYIVNADGTHARKIADHIVPEYADLHGNGFYYYPRNRGEYNIYYYDLITKCAKRIVNKEIKTTRLNVSPDGKKEWVSDAGGHGDWYNSEPASLYIKNRNVDPMD